MAANVLRTLHAAEREERPRWIEYPARVSGLELHGPMPDTGFDREQWLASLNGRYFALTPILYRILEQADGVTSAEAIAERVSRSGSQTLTADDIRWLVVHRLAPAGLVRCPTAEASTIQSKPARNKPLLSIRARMPLLQPEWIAPLTGLLQHLFWRPIVFLSLGLIAVLHVWIYTAGSAALGDASRLLFFEPRWILLVFAMELGASLFHEFGHAAAMRRAGCPHGPIGFGVYLIWPVFYTDVTPIYRLRRNERLRVDLGGMYFHQLAALGFAGLYLVTGWPLWLLGVVIADVQCLRQLNPFFRFDGYYILADLLGVPDPLSQIKPFLRSLRRRPTGAPVAANDPPAFRGLSGHRRRVLRPPVRHRPRVRRRHCPNRLDNWSRLRASLRAGMGSGRYPAARCGEHPVRLLAPLRARAHALRLVGFLAHHRARQACVASVHVPLLIDRCADRSRRTRAAFPFAEHLSA